MFFSEFFQIDLSNTGVFDSLLDKDSNFFINVIRLKKTKTPEFVAAYQHLNQYFTDIAILLHNADSPDMRDPFYRSARKRLTFHEINGINLGFSKSIHGAGWGDVISDQVLRDAYYIIKKGSMQPEIFHLVSLFEDNIAGDRLSDMIACIIEDDIIKYTLRIMNQFNISKKSHPEMTFLANGLVANPYKDTPIMLLPVEILHELPIAKDWYDIDRVVTENEAIRREINKEIGLDWEKWASSARKEYIKNRIFMKPDVCKRVIDGYKSEELGDVNLKSDPDYFAESLLKDAKKTVSFLSKNKSPSSYEAAMDIIEIFKDWVENNRGWAEIQSAPSKSREKAVQRFIHLGAKYYLQINNIDLSPESNSGRGPVDLKLSRGNDKTLAEIKLSTNNEYLHGYQLQIIEYSKAERTQNMIYVFIDVGNPGRLERIKNLYRKTKRNGAPYPELVVVNSNERKAASNYSEIEDFELPEIGFDDFPDFDDFGLENGFLQNEE